MKKGLFISFEGIDGSGKGTQIELLAAHLRRQAHFVNIGREPGGLPICEAIREVLLNPSLKTDKMEPMTELLLFLAPRCEYTNKLVKPTLKQGDTFISDRYRESTKAYQGYGLGLNLDLIDRLNDEVTGGLLPDLTLVLDLDPIEAMKRVRSSSKEFDSAKTDSIESRALQFHTRVREGYLEMARREPNRIKVISDIPGNPEEMHRQITYWVDSFLSYR